MGMGGSNKKGPISEINVTPLVDVMLVLLIIFMVTAPMMFNGIQLKLPKTKKVSSLNLTGELVVLSITEKEEYYLGKHSCDGSTRCAPGSHSRRDRPDDQPARL